MKQGISTKAVLLGVGGLILVIVLAYFSWQLLIKPALAVVPTWGSEVTSEAVNAPSWLQSLLGEQVFQSWNALIVFLAVFMILLLALADILTAFSTFSEGTAWGIAIGLSVIGVMTGVVNKLVVATFGGAAAIGAIGIGLIVIWAVFVAVAMNFVVGWSGIKAMREAKMDQQAVNTAVSNYSTAMRTLKGIAKETRNEGKDD